jgi:hypothetical protein
MKWFPLERLLENVQCCSRQSKILQNSRIGQMTAFSKDLTGTNRETGENPVRTRRCNPALFLLEKRTLLAY